MKAKAKDLLDPEKMNEVNQKWPTRPSKNTGDKVNDTDLNNLGHAVHNPKGFLGEDQYHQI
jgi:hypothetical protein